ncbi:protein translocase subunit SecD [Actinoalloteichus sp. AHMU CJ021]|uniref:Multifunctional fusion protein n=2 Tax=Actinoalloteichus cyanogriseus TaxID=2893586 RepID=A0ABT1JCX1_ACTCY|nr:protein translocase subunit SecD [Actinoalloteichus caeruleus]AUS80633.1 protein translocase subunit SecD [Actinoalloteichus sp. AHMU CJ021]MCP2330016.1 SecD/SecF fusion protein [Actinoalloteichus caeruleus DSM 43889]
MPPPRSTRSTRSSDQRSLLLRGLLALLVLLGAGTMLLTTEPRLGLDLQGGTQITLEAEEAPGGTLDDETMDQTLEVLRRRVDSLGVAEPNLIRSGSNRIVVEMPGVQDPEEALETIGRTAQLTIHPVVGLAPPEESTPPEGDSDQEQTGELVLPDESGQRLQLAPAAMTGEAINRATARLDGQQGLGWHVSLDFHDGRGWADITGQAACAPNGDPARRVAIVLDNEIISAPQVTPDVRCNVGITGGTTQITGDFTEEESNQLALLISDGALPVQVEVVEQRTVGPTLGQDAIDASVMASIIGVALTGLFLLVVYRMAGLIATIALAGYTAIAYGLMLAIGATFTLPGLAGFVLAIGMAMDANVLIYERSREEYAAGAGTKSPVRRMQNAVTGGFRGALTAIADSNITTLLAAALLFALAAGPVRGFGVTLSVGVAVSMFSAFVLSRVLQQLTFRGVVARKPAISGIASIGRVRQWFERRSPDFYRRHRRWLVGSLVVLLVVGLGLAVRGLNLGVEYTGGRYLEYSSSEEVDLGDVRSELAAAGFPDAQVSSTDDNGISVRTVPLDESEVGRIADAVSTAAGGEVEQLRSDLIGPSMGNELRNQAILAFLLAVLVQVIYLSFRFDWRLAVAVMAGLAADILFLLGFFAWTGRLVDGVFIASMLTVIGYSVNDSVVVFDRVRELRASHPKDPFFRVAGLAILQTMPRTINTGIGVFAVLGALLFLGGGSLVDFALAVIVGSFVGNVTTITVASPFAVLLDTRWPGAARPKKKKRRDENSTGAVV